MGRLESHRVLVTGVGIQPVRTVFRDRYDGLPSHTAVVDGNGTEWKANIGAAVAHECAKQGAVVRLIARTQDKLDVVRTWIERDVPNAVVESSACDLSDRSEIDRMAAAIPRDGKTLYWVQSVGLGAGSVRIKNDNPYLPVTEIGPDLIEAELGVIKSTIDTYQALAPLFYIQNETRVVIITSMSGVRSVAPGIIHAAAKGGLARLANGLRLEEHGKGVLVTDVRPGGIDTGMYDSPIVQQATIPIAARYGEDWTEAGGGLRLSPPSSVAEHVALALTTRAHITSINLLGHGQWPHEGS